MKFLIDAHLPRRLAQQLRNLGYDAIHTLELPNGNRTTDIEINTLSMRENYVVTTKDSDFVNSFLIANQPYKLLIISTGNITNKDLEALFMPNLPAIDLAFQEHRYLELTRTNLIIHL